MLLKKYRIKFLVLWGNKTEFEEGTHMNNLFPEDVVLIPEAKIRYLAAVIQRCKVIIGNDTGPLHIASALDVPALGIYGPTNPKLQGPFGEEHVTAQHPKLDCLHCDLTECPIGNICMTELPKEQIVKRFDELIAKNKINIPIREA
jgi:heptosyltransferase-2